MEGLLLLGQVAPLGADIVTSHVLRVLDVIVKLPQHVLQVGTDNASAKLTCAWSGEYVDVWFSSVEHKLLRRYLVMDSDISAAIFHTVFALLVASVSMGSAHERLDMLDDDAQAGYESVCPRANQLLDGIVKHSIWCGLELPIPGPTNLVHVVLAAPPVGAEFIQAMFNCHL